MPEISSSQFHQMSIFGPEEVPTTPGSDRPRKPGPWVDVQSSRLNQARYDGASRQVQVIFRDGTPWTYAGVPRNIWNNFRRSSSKGKYINRILNGYPYWRGGFDYDDSDGWQDRDR